MIKYIEIDYYDWQYLKDKSGYYKVLYNNIDNILYYKDGLLHNETGPAMLDKNWGNAYFLNDENLGDDDDWNDETWKVFAAKYMKLIAFA